MPTLLLFAAIRDAAGTARADVEGGTIGEALSQATQRYGERFATILERCSVLLGDDVVDRTRLWDHAVTPETEIAILPPVSGGGDVRMVDVADKDESAREATAVCELLCTETAHRDQLLAGAGKKGDAVGPATVAGMLAAKRVPELLPHCHPVRITKVDVAIEASGEHGILVRTTVRGRDRTGFEMEALTACSIASLTLYDIGKADDPRMRVTDLRVIAKSGGKSGDVTYA